MEGICQAYHWLPRDVMELTVPQILMLNHAAWVNRERMERRSKQKNDYVEEVAPGKTIEELDSEELKRYYGKFHEFSPHIVEL